MNILFNYSASRTSLQPLEKNTNKYLVVKSVQYYFCVKNLEWPPHNIYRRQNSRMIIRMQLAAPLRSSKKEEKTLMEGSLFTGTWRENFLERLVGHVSTKYFLHRDIYF